MRILSLRDPCPVTIESDGYVPVMARFQGAFEFPPLYWRTGDFRRTLVEIGVEKSSGAICKVTVTLVDGLRSGCESEIDVMALREGISCADIALFGTNTRVDVEHEVVASLEDSQLIVRFGDGVPAIPESCRSGNVSFLVSAESELCGVAFSAFSIQQIANLRFAAGGDG